MASAVAALAAAAPQGMAPALSCAQLTQVDLGDLSAFRAAGGKLILWAGWADPAISPVGTFAYYRAVQRAMGSATPTDRFARLCCGSWWCSLAGYSQSA